MRVLRAKHVSQNRWLQRLDSGDKSESEFLQEAAAQFSVSPGDLQAIVTDWTEAQRQQAVAEMMAGTHEGLQVIPAPVPLRPAVGRYFLRNGLLPSVSGANNNARVDRLAGVMVADPAISAFVGICNTYETLTAGDHLVLRKLWARKKVETQGGFSAAEVIAIEGAAPAYGIALP